MVEFTASGHVLRQWDIKGKRHGLTADPERRVVIATVNEDANSSVYTIAPDGPAAAAVQHFRYNRPLPHKGGFVLRSGRLGSHLAVLRLSQSVDDSAWALSRSGRLYASDATSDSVDVVTGPVLRSRRVRRRDAVRRR